MGSLWPRSCGVESYSYLSRNCAYPTTVVSSIPARGKVHSIHLWWWWCMVINTNFNNISVISRRSVLLLEETGENHRPVTSH